MKTKILIIEDEFCRFFPTKQILESQLKVPVRIIGATSQSDMIAQTVAYAPHTVVLQGTGGVADLLKKLRDKKVNRLNSEITLMITGSVGESFIDLVNSYLGAQGCKHVIPLRLQAA